jgi:hypothetical protein
LAKNCARIQSSCSTACAVSPGLNCTVSRREGLESYVTELITTIDNDLGDR